jgi:hypothetical protein
MWFRWTCVAGICAHTHTQYVLDGETHTNIYYIFRIGGPPRLLDLVHTPTNGKIDELPRLPMTLANERNAPKLAMLRQRLCVPQLVF